MKANLLTVIFIISFLVFSQKVRANEGHLRFVENKGQISDQYHQPRTDIKYVVGAGKFTCHLKKQGFSYQLFNETGRPETPVRPIDRYKHRNDPPGTFHFYRLDMNWLNSNPNVDIISGDELPGYDNYYLAVCPQGATHVKSFSRVSYKNLYDGVDMNWHEMNGQLKYDYVVKAGADYRKIQWEIKGADRLKITSSGQLIIETPLGNLVEEAPVVFQDGKKLLAAWQVSGNLITFYINNVDVTKELIIDPLVRAWGTYFGGSGYDELAYSHADAFNNVYFSGATSSATSLNIATVGSHQSTYGGALVGQMQGDALLLKLDANGTRLWSTYYGGSYGEWAGGCSSDSQGNIYMVGATSSSNAGVISTAGAFQPTLTASPTVTWTSDVFLAKFTPAGTRIWATYYGDSLWDWANGILVDKNDNVFISGGTEYVASTSTVFATPGAHQLQSAGGNFDAFIAKFSSSGTRLWSTYFGGENTDQAYYCAADTLGNVYITGMTTSTTALTIASANAHQTVYSGGVSDAYLAKFSPTGVRLWSTYYGDHTEEYGNNCAVDHLNGVVLFGTTDSFLGSNFGTVGAHQPAYGGGNSEGFVAKFSASGVRRWGTYYGGVGYEELGVGCVSKSGSIFICGRSSIGSGTAIATCGTYQDLHGGGVNDCFIAHFDSLGKRQWGTFFGGAGDEPTWSALTIDANNNLYLAGMTKATTASSILVTSGGHQTTYGGGTYDLFIERFNPCMVTPPISSGAPACVGQQAIFQSNSNCISKWYSDAALKNLISTGPTFTFSILTSDTSFYYADESCGFSKAAEVSLQAGVPPVVTVNGATKRICVGETVTLTPNGAATYSWTGYIETGELIIKPNTTTNYTIAGFSAEGCKSTTTVQVQVDACAGLAEQNQLFTWAFYPNPVNELAEIKVDQLMRFSLQGISGNIIWKEQEVGPTTSLDFSQLPEGIYFGRLRSETTTQIFKVVVVK